MKILAIDTSSKICSIALLENENIIDEINLDNGRTHSENLMPKIQEIFNKNNIQLSQMNLISCCTGPGSFTGIRIGVSSIKAIAEVYNIPIANITSLEILARIDESDKTKVSLIDARNNQVYCGIFDENYNPKEDFIADDIYVIIERLKKYKNIICIGDGAILHKEKLEKCIENIEFSDENNQRAALGGLIAYKKYMKNDLYTADTITPIYLKKSQAERQKENLNA